MHSGNALAKGQAHAAAALLAGAGFIHHIKRLGHAGQLIRRDAAAVVLHGQRHSVPGIGQQLVTALNNRDYPLAQGCTVIMAIFVMIVNLVVDLAYKWCDPRVNLE